MTSRVLIKTLPIFFFTFTLLVQVEASAVQQQPPQATSQEESFMLGRILGAIQDSYGGYFDEARGRR